jgi:hypothetical protein
MVNVVKFSQFTNGGDLANDEITVGLGGSAPYYNAYYNNPWTFLPPGTTGDRPAIASTMYYRLRLNTSLQQYEYYDPILMDWVQVVTSDLFDWIDVTTSPYQMIGNQGYIANGGSLIELILPVTALEGEVIAVAGKGAGGWSITQGVGQSIKIAPVSTTVGTLGSLSSTQPNDSIELICIVDNTTWSTRGGPQGTLTYL